MKNGDAMKENILKIIEENTRNRKYSENTVANISEQLKTPKSSIMSNLQDLVGKNEIIKIDAKPIYFVSKFELEKKYNIKIKDRKIANLESFLASFTKEKRDFEKLIGFDGSLSTLVEQCKATVSYPPYGLPMMLHGPTGTGKSLIAKLTYEYARNKKLLKDRARFVSINCSEYANNPELLTANLFGYVKGAFTGADKDTAGLIELADGGILFLDEVHNLKGECQEKLFQFMDQSTYHRVGDNKTWYTSQVRIIFATTEDQEKVLLKTLQRRIPMTIEVPDLEARGIQEKIKMLHFIFDMEQKKLDKKIKMTSRVYNALISYKFPGNIGGLKSAIQSCCINSLFQINKSGEMEITLRNIPNSILKELKIEKLGNMSGETFIYVDDLLNFFQKGNKTIGLCNEVIELYDTYENSKTSVDDYLSGIQKRIFTYLDSMLTNQSKDYDFYQEGTRRILEEVSKQYHLDLTNNEILSIFCLFSSFVSEHQYVEKWSLENSDKLRDIIDKIKENYFLQYNIATEVFRHLEHYLDMKMTDITLILFTIFLLSLEKSNNLVKRDAVILAHGFSTASSIASAANQFLDQYIFDAIDMPLNVDTNTVIKQLNSYIRKLGNIEELILLVDMGSLEEIYKGLNLENVNVGIINQVTTQIALEIGSSLKQNQPLEEMFEKVSNMHVKYRIEKHRAKEPLIVCSCMSGIGVAEKLKEVILSSLPLDSKVKVETYNYNDLLSKGINSGLFEDNRVLCVVGTLNPNLEGLNFVAIEDLIIDSDSNCFDYYLKDCLDKEEIEIFKKNIVKNFSLSNIMNSLTILNPNKLLEHVADALDRLQIMMKMRLSSKVCLGLYVHVSCLIERLVLNQGIEVYPDLEKFKKEQSILIECIKKSFKGVEQFYRVNIPIGEIGYIYDYIKNQDQKNDEEF